MGLFDFAKNIGDKLFGDDEEPVDQSQKIKSHVEKDNPGVRDLEVSINEGVVSLKGEAESSEALEKAVLLAGNVQGVEKVMAVTVKTPDEPKVEYYEIVSGPAGEAPDAERDRSLHHPDAWVAIAGEDSAGKPMVQVMSLDDYHGDNAPRQTGFWEWETDRVVSRSGNMVHVWSTYASARTPEGEPFATGVNSITLFFDGSRWWIMGWMFDSGA